ncbi:hypothetical protein NQ317_006771 [Molorchus minor]|uniref:Major facilitator superfamily (MFS) profile domain-containing protein n=1 Tax=Molorchus minor TaxID=1323400 RepID=A0ABQ9JP38_9CUCU|nr:hypothetical protein NQ317_006771 [Molorchus minor]
MAKSAIDNSLDAILEQLGDFGKYQKYVFTLVFIPIIMHSAVHVAYVFTAVDLTYRCEVPPCDSNSTTYEPDWLINAVPYSDGTPEKCDMYTYNSTQATNSSCSSDAFNTEEIVRCSSFIYETNEASILQEYNLQCSNNLWKLTLVGTINSFGQFSGLFIAGALADRYGRKVILVWGMVLCAVCGLIRTAMPYYELFMVLEYLDAFFSSGTFITGFVLAAELVGPKKRALAGSIACSGSAFGGIITSAAAWMLKSWRPLIYALYTPCFLLISYLWLIPESIRWNIEKGRIEEAKMTLRKIAKVNGKELSEKALDQIDVAETEHKTNQNDTFIRAIKSRILLLRFLNSCVCWLSCAFLYYGLSLSSVTLASGNKYLNFLLTSLVEIPAMFLCIVLLPHFGSRRSLSAFYFLTGVACAAFIFIPSDAYVASLSVYLTGKFAATAAFTAIYVLTTEMFPTVYRQSFMNACSTVSRCGIMIAPQMPLLGAIWTNLPLVCFSAIAIVATFLTLLFPETLNMKLPDTIEEAENMSKLRKGELKENRLQDK